MRIRSLLKGGEKMMIQGKRLSTSMKEMERDHINSVYTILRNKTRNGPDVCINGMYFMKLF
jgi:hypothetical protein